jgi:hypothetical protein
MRTHFILASLILFGSPSAQAQIRATARLGAVWSSKLATDEIVEKIDVTTGIGPMLALGVSIPSGTRFRLGLETVLSTASVTAEAAGGNADLGTLRTASLMLTAEGPLMVRGFFWRAGAGMIKYLPAEKQGIFLQGGPSRIIGNFTVEYRKPLSPGWEGVGGVRYGFHQFTTKQLEAHGFSRGQAVHRVGLEVGVARYF